MKLTYFLLLLFVVISVGCHRKLRPSGTPTATNTNKNTANAPLKPLLDSAEAAGGTATPAPTVVAKPIIIVNAQGNFAVSAKDLPPDASHSILNNANARAYTPAELKTLSYRFKQIPPRILYVPASLQKKNSRGTYYVFLKKYWYWMKSNGYFYLDEAYYK